MNKNKKPITKSKILYQALFNVGEILFCIIAILIIAFSIYFIIQNGSLKIDTKNLSASIIALIVCLAFLGAMLLLILNNIFITYRILSGKYIITEDILINIEHFYTGDVDSSHNAYYNYFKDIFKTYRKRVEIRPSIYRKETINNSYYIIFIKGSNYVTVFNKENYFFDEREKNNIIKVEDLCNYIKKYKKVENKNKVQITNDVVLKKYFDAYMKKSMFMLIFLWIFILVANIIISFEIKKYLPFFLIILILLSIAIIIEFYDIFHTISCIKNKKYIIKEDEIIEIRNSKHSDEQSNNSNNYPLLLSQTITFKNYKRQIGYLIKEYGYAEIGDKYYLVFLDESKKPIALFNANNFKK